MTSSRITISFAAIMLLGVGTPASTEQSEPGAGGELFEDAEADGVKIFEETVNVAAP
jgi:hypothetical protein